MNPASDPSSWPKLGGEFKRLFPQVNLAQVLAMVGMYYLYMLYRVFRGVYRVYIVFRVVMVSMCIL